MGFATIEAQSLDHAAAYRMITGCVIPRPVAWITTTNHDGLVNVAPFSSYNYVASAPPMVAVNIAKRAGKLKDTARNIVNSGEFVVNLPDEASLEVMHLTSAEHAADVSEAHMHDIDLVPSRFVRPPRIAATPIQLECMLDQAVVLGERFNTLYIARVVAFHLSDAIFDGHHIDVAKIRPVARMSGPHYAIVKDVIRRDPPFIPPGVARPERA